MTDYEDLQKRCQRGATNLNDANSLLAACYETLGAIAAERDQIKAEGELLRHQLGACSKELRRASSWICREVYPGTASATHWAIRLTTNADQIDAAIGKEG